MSNNILKNIYQYRELLKTNIKKDIRGRYKGSFLGVLWSFINPLLQSLVYAIVFPYLLGSTGNNYIVYLVVGIIPWTFFLTTVSAGTTSIKANAGIIKKVYFPREILPISQALSGIINFFISCFIIILFCLGFKIGISYHILAVPVIAFVQMIFVLGLSFILSAINAYIQDTEYIVGFILTMAFYASPIVYKLEQFQTIGSGKAAFVLKLIKLNPMTIMITGYRNAFMYHIWPDWKGLLYVFIISTVLVIIGYIIFKKLEKRFAEQF